MSLFAASYKIEGSLHYRLLDGSENNKCYTIGANKNVVIAGRVEVSGYNAAEVETNAYGQKVSTQTTYINLYESNSSGKGVKVCGDTVKVSSGSIAYVASGTTQFANKKYMYIYKPMNDGYDLEINGSISY